MAAAAEAAAHLPTGTAAGSIELRPPGTPESGNCGPGGGGGGGGGGPSLASCAAVEAVPVAAAARRLTGLFVLGSRPVTAQYQPLLGSQRP